jgi:ParB-like chromosome segregation protein Spo0J
MKSYERPFGPAEIRDVPVSSFRPQYLEYLRASTQPDRVANYTKTKIDTPIVVLPSRFGGLQVSDGGHRLLAAIDRGDSTIKAIIGIGVQA